MPGNLSDCQNEEDSDLWDDTALIMAYDNAVSSLKSKMGGAAAEPSLNGTCNATTTNKNKKKHKKNKRKKERLNQLPLWRVGSNCRAVYSEDGQLYDAVIKSVDAQRGRCVVVYTEYGNEEQQLLSELLHSRSRLRNSTSDVASDVVSEVDGLESIHSSCSSIIDKKPSVVNHKSSADCSAHKSSRYSASAKPTHYTGFAQPPSGYPSFPFPAPPGMFASSRPGWGDMPPRPAMFGGAPPCIPGIPPPPMPGDDCALDDREALYSMLIAWYMSGYHTGYYQGLKQRRTTATDADSQSDSQTASSSRHNTDR